MTDITEIKKAFRADAKKRRRAAYFPDNAERFAEAEADIAWRLWVGDTIALYAAIQTEPDVFELGERLMRAGFRLALPVVIAEATPLEWRSWKPEEPLTEGAFGARIPSDEAEVVTPDALLVPLLAFDAAKNRMGYGGGFYDRSIEAIAPKLTIGVAFAGQEVPAVPVEPTDRQLDLILTEEGLR